MRNLANGLKTGRDLTGSVRLLEPIGTLTDAPSKAIYGERCVAGEIKRVVIKHFTGAVDYFDDWLDVSKHSTFLSNSDFLRRRT